MRFLFLISGVLLCLNFQGQWQFLDGPYSRVLVNDLVTDGSKLFAGTECGLFYRKKSDDYWEKLNHSNTFFVSIQSDTLIVSNVFGVLLLDLNSPDFDTINFYQANFSHGPRRVVLRNNVLIMTSSKGLSYSSPPGSAWQSFHKGLPMRGLPQGARAFEILDFTVHNDTIYCATEAGVYTTTFDLAKFEKSGKGSKYFRRISVHQGNFYAIHPDSIYRSSDKGKTWKPIAEAHYHDLTGRNSIIAYKDGLYLSLEHDKVVRSLDSGKTWHSWSDGLSKAKVIWHLDTAFGKLLAFEVGKRHYELNYESYWEANTNLNLGCFYSEELTQNRFGLFTSDFAGVYRFDGLNGWDDVTPEDSVDWVFHQVTSINSTLYISGVRYSGFLNQQLDSIAYFTSGDGGKTWRSHPWSKNLRDLKFEQHGGIKYALGKLNIYTSFDKGKTWNLARYGGSSQAYSNATGYRFFDEKFYYTAPQSGLPYYDPINDRWGHESLPDPAAVVDRIEVLRDKIFAFGPHGNYYREAQGTWQKMPSAPRNVKLSSTYGDSVYVLAENIVWASDTSATDWQPITTPLRSTLAASHMAVDHNSVFLGNHYNHNGAGIFRYKFREKKSEPISNHHKMLIYPNPSDGSIRLETGIPGIYSCSVSDLNGRAVYLTETADDQIIDLSGLDSGVYFVSVFGNGRFSTIRFFKR